MIRNKTSKTQDELISTATQPTVERDPLTERIIGCALEVHRHLGPGLLESAYHRCLAAELSDVGIAFVSEAAVPLQYKGVALDCGYRIDLLVEGRLVVELKTIDAIAPIHLAQLLTYMKLSEARVGLLINFQVALLKDGIRRLVL